MLHPPKPLKTQYPSLKSLQIEQIEAMSFKAITQKMKENKYLDYKRHGIFQTLKQKFILEESHQFDDIAQVLSQYFKFGINSMYETVQKLPIQVFVCGQCKEVFFRGVEYILHCAEFGCRVNHERSTYFVYWKDNQALVKNQEIQKILTENNITSEEYIFFNKNFVYFADYEFKRRTPNQKGKNEFKCGKCGQIKNFGIRQGQIFFRHFIGICKSYKHKQSSHELIIIENKQSKEEFFGDIKNFYLNYNIMFHFENSYVKIHQNKKLQGKNYHTNQFYCSNCNLDCKDSEQFLKHALFECHAEPNDASSHILILKKSPYIIAIKPSYKQKCSLITRLFVQNEKKNLNQNSTINKKWSQLTVKINSKYNKIWKGNEKIYFCACCFNLYEDFGLYLAHFNLTCCTVNHEDNSHFLFSPQNQPLTTQKLRSYVEEEDVNFFFNFGLAAIKEFKLQNLIELIHRETGQVLSMKIPITCGKCGVTKKMQKIEYLAHVFKKCKSPYHPKNSHIIVYKPKLIVTSEIKRFVKDAHYCLQIIKMVENKKTFIQRNEDFGLKEFFGVNSMFYCGKCQTWLEGQYDFFHHYLTKCDGINSPNSSHFLHQDSCVRKNASSNAFEIVKYRNCKNGKIKIHKNKKIMKTISQTESEIEDKSQQEIFEEKLQQIPEEEIEQQKSKKKNQIFQKENICEKQMDQHTMNKNNTDQTDITQKGPQNFETDEYLEMYPNIDFDSDSNEDTKYHCGKCKLSFKKKQSFVDHIFICENYSHPQSSHFILTQTKFNDIHWDHLIKLNNFKENCHRSYHSYVGDHKDVVCGCGATKIFGLTFHMGNLHAGIIPKGTSHFVLRVKIPKTRNPVQIFLPIEPKPLHENDLFVCPCNPFKKLPYRAFANHIVKRHEGKSPLFYMRNNLSEGPQKMELY